MYLHQFVLLAASLTFNHATGPFNPASGGHEQYIAHRFYEEFHFHDTNSDLDAIKLTNNAEKSLEPTVSASDDVPEVRIDLEWDFKFYGHLHSWISISPNGFLTTHPVTCGSFCNWWQDSSSNYRRYIAPLMVDLDPSAFADSKIFFYINNTEKSLSVQWHNVSLWQPNNTTQLEYRFDFQVKLYSSGDIYFYYFTLPKLPNEIRVPGNNEKNYTLTVGLEDAAYQHALNGLYYVRPYQPVDVNLSHVQQSHVIVFVPRATCIDQVHCGQCQDLVKDPGSDLECGWCPELGLCSDGIGREVYEYYSEEFCTENEMLKDLSSETCIDYEVNERKCVINDHVLARYPRELTVTGASRFYSGVIVGMHKQSNTYLVDYDDSSLQQSKVAYSSVHPCSTVSYDYSSRDLPPHCVPHCTHVSGGDDDKMEKIRHIAIAVGVMLAICVVTCAAIQLLLHSRRSPPRNSNQAYDEQMNGPIDSFWTSNSAPRPVPMQRGRMFVPDEDPNEVDEEFVSRRSERQLANKLNSSVEMEEMVDGSVANSYLHDRNPDSVNVDVVELGEVELEYSSHANVAHADGNSKEWDMTALRQ